MNDLATAAGKELPGSHPPIVSPEEWQEAWQQMLAGAEAIG